MLPEEIGDISFPHRALEDYTVALSNIVEPEQIAARRFKLVIDYGYGATSFVMPNVLAKLGADVLAVNPYASTHGRLSFDLEAASRRVGDLVRASGAHLGAVFDPDGERLTLIDDEGDVLTDTEATLAFVELVCDHLLGDRIALPVNVTGHAERIAQRARRHRAAHEDLDAGADGGRGRAGRRLRRRRPGRVHPPRLPPGVRRRGGAREGARPAGPQRSPAVRGPPGPAAVHMTHETVVTPWEQKGLVMRSLVEQADGELVLVDGVKVCHGHDWALALPDPDEPVTHVWAEAATAADARALAKEYARRIRQLVR